MKIIEKGIGCEEFLKKYDRSWNKVVVRKGESYRYYDLEHTESGPRLFVGLFQYEKYEGPEKVIGDHNWCVYE